MTIIIQATIMRLLFFIFYYYFKYSSIVVKYDHIDISTFFK